MQIDLTERDVSVLLTLVRREARWSGYGSHWFQDNRSQWPRKLKRLSTVARKLQTAREQASGT